MNYVVGSIWSLRNNNQWVVIPINTQVKHNGRLVMGAGLAKQAVERYPHVDLEFASLLKEGVKSIFIDKTTKLVGIPTKNHWMDKSTLPLIERGMVAIKFFSITHDLKSQEILCPMLGCGLGEIDTNDFIRLADEVQLDKYCTIVSLKEL